MAASLCSSSLTETIVGGFLQIEYTRTYKMNLADTSEAEATALNTAGVDAIAAPYNFNGILVYCYQRVPRRSNDANERLLWYVTCSFTNDTSRFMRNEQGQPIQVNSGESVLDVAPQLDINFETIEVKDDRGEFVGAYEWDGTPRAVTTSVYTGQHEIGKDEWISSTAGAPIPDSELPLVYVPTIEYIYWRVVRDWDNTWANALGKHNSDSVTITQRDSDGVRFQKTYDPNRLKLKNIIKQDMWVDGKLFFKVGFVIVENYRYRGMIPTGFESQTEINWFEDRGQKRLIFAGQYKQDGTTYTSAELIEATGVATGSYMEEIRDPPDALGISALIGEPIRLNGTGSPASYKRSDNTRVYSVLLGYKMGNVVSFASLGIS